MTPEPSDDTLLSELRLALGETSVLTGRDIPEHNLRDASSYPPARPRALLLPRTTQDVSAALAICHAHGQPVAVQGGMTGLSGGAVAAETEVAISMERMRGVEEVDTQSRTLTALAGTCLEDIQKAAEEQGLLCGIDLGSRGTCTIGGNVATNAGGNRVIQYGMTRQNILGLEAVLADGSVVTNLGKMLKNNTGYDWPQLLAGSEGTLGVITRVVVRLHPRPREVLTVALAIDGFDTALGVLHRLQETFPRQLLAFEVMWREFQELAASHCHFELPFAQVPDVMALVEISVSEATGARDRIEEYLASMMEERLIDDALVAASEAQVERLWRLRESSSQYRSHGFRVVGYDISLPHSSIGAAVEHLRVEGSRKVPDIPVYCFGHAADSNIHVCAVVTDIENPELGIVSTMVYDCVRKFGGSVSAEHGIGRTKIPYLPISRSETEIDLMRRLKAGLDPRGLLNPGRIL